MKFTQISVIAIIFDGSTIYFAVDYDAVQTEIESGVTEFFKGINDTVKNYTRIIHEPIAKIFIQKSSSFCYDIITMLML